jgi:hypothetical protein
MTALDFVSASGREGPTWARNRFHNASKESKAAYGLDTVC